MSNESWLQKLLAEKIEGVWRNLDPAAALRLLGYKTAPGLSSAPGAHDDSPGGVAARLAGLRKEFEEAEVRLGIIGESGAGKSSLINAIVGKPVAKVGSLIETTQGPQEVPVNGVTLVDLPGCGTPTWPRETYLKKLRLLESYDGFILVTASRLKECDAMLYQELARKAKKPFFVVRSHFDVARAAHGEQEARAIIAPHIRQQLGADPAMPVYMVASVGPNRFDLEHLILDVRRALPEWKQVRFIMAAHAYGENTIARKREAAEKIVGVHAGLSAANALNPIPGLDVSIDLGILAAMSRHVISTYGFTKEQVASLKTQANVKAAVVQGFQQVAERFTPYLTEQFIASALRRFGVGVLVKDTSKWVPFVGTLVSAGLGYQLTYRFGESLIDDCEAAARDMVRAVPAD